MNIKKIELNVLVSNIDELTESQQSLVQIAKKQFSKAYAPYSNFCVGAAVELENGEIIAASNQENSAYPSGLCAERVAMFYANSKFPDTPVRTLAIAAFTGGRFLEEPITPCGSCRQVLLETENRYRKPITIILYGTSKVFIINGIRELLPLSFDSDSLNP